MFPFPIWLFGKVLGFSNLNVFCCSICCLSSTNPLILPSPPCSLTTWRLADILYQVIPSMSTHWPFVFRTLSQAARKRPGAGICCQLLSGVFCFQPRLVSCIADMHSHFRGEFNKPYIALRIWKRSLGFIASSCFTSSSGFPYTSLSSSVGFEFKQIFYFLWARKNHVPAESRKTWGGIRLNTK